MTELATFLTNTSGGGSGGTSQFRTATINTQVAVTPGEKVFINYKGTVKTEKQLTSFEVNTPRISSIYGSTYASALSTFYDKIRSPVLLDPNAIFSVAYNGAGNYRTIVNGEGSDIYSCKLSGGFWLVFSYFGDQVDFNRGAPYLNTNSYNATVLSSDGKSLMCSVGLTVGALNPYDTGMRNKVLAIVPNASGNSAVVYMWSLNSGDNTTYYLYRSVLTFNGTNNVTVSGLTQLATWTGTAASVPPVITNPVVTYGGNTYVMMATSSTNLRLINVDTSVATNLTFGARFAHGDALHAVMAGSAVHIYPQTGSGTIAISVVNLATLTAVTTGLPTHLALTNSSDVVVNGGSIIRLDTTTYAYVSGSTKLITVRVSSDGFTTATTTSVSSVSGGAVALYLIDSKLILVRAVYGATAAAGVSGCVYIGRLSGFYYLSELTYNSGAATCSLSTVTSATDVFGELITSLSIPGCSYSPIDLSSCLALTYIVGDTGKQTNHATALVYQVFSPEHYHTYAPKLIGVATTGGTSPTVVLSDDVKTYTGTSQGSVITAGLVGVATDLAVSLDVQRGVLSVDETVLSGTNTDTRESYSTLKGFSHAEITTGTIVASPVIAAADRVVTLNSSISASGSTNGIAGIYFLCNGRLRALMANTSVTTTAIGYTNNLKARYKVSWPWVLSTSVSGGFNDSLSISISGLLEENML